jgi:fatty acid desaturase
LTGVFLGWVIIPILSRWVVGNRGRLAEPVEPVPQHVEANQARKAEVSKREKLLDLLAIPPVQAVLFGLFWLATGQWWGYFAFWALPLVTVGAGLNALRATIEHANPDEHATAEDPHEILFSFVSNPIERFFVCPLHFNYHYEHHRFMNVPYYHAPKLRQALIDRHDYTNVTLVPSYARRVVQICRRLRERSRELEHAASRDQVS